MRYYSLTFKTACEGHKFGESILNASAPLTIGQQQHSNIVLPCSQELLPQHFCTIIMNNDGKSWRLVVRTDYYPILVNNSKICYCCQLHDGDEIKVEDAILIFHTHNDENYTVDAGIVSIQKNSRKIKLICVLMTLLVLAIISGISVPIYNQRMNKFTDNDETALQSSVFKIVTDTIDLQMSIHGSAFRTIDQFVPDSVSVGTCFFTTDGKCITARHCVEPWIDFNGWSDESQLESLPKTIQWVAQTENCLEEGCDTLYRVSAHCHVMKGDSCLFTFASTNCSFNRSRDIIMRMGVNQIPWRVIYPLFNQRDTELGDFAFIDTGIKGCLYIGKNLSDILQGEHTIRLYGYPRKNGGNIWESQDVRNLSLPDKNSEGNYTGCIRMSVDGTEGYSGCPVIVKHNGKMNVVGVFSKIDDYDNSRRTFYAVPITEVSNYNPKKANEQRTYRR